MSAYQKVYMNQIHSSSLLCQLAHMWKSNLLCDAVIRTGRYTTKAHRVVLVAACPMLQSMENASAGSHLEVKLAADIKQDSVNTFLQYLYEGFMMLTEENVREVEKIGRLLQVDSVTKCCVDFYKCLQEKTGAQIPGSSYKCTINDTIEFRHVRTTQLQKTVHDRMLKRATDFSRPGSLGFKRQKMNKGGSLDLPQFGADKADDTVSMANSYMNSDPWDSAGGLGMGRKGPSFISMVEDSLEMKQTEPPGKDPVGTKSRRKTSVSVAVTSQYNTEPDIRAVSIESESEDKNASLPCTSDGLEGASSSINVADGEEQSLGEAGDHKSPGGEMYVETGLMSEVQPGPSEGSDFFKGENSSSSHNNQDSSNAEDDVPDLNIVKVEALDQEESSDGAQGGDGSFDDETSYEWWRSGASRVEMEAAYNAMSMPDSNLNPLSTSNYPESLTEDHPIPVKAYKVKKEQERDDCGGNVMTSRHFGNMQQDLALRQGTDYGQDTTVEEELCNAHITSSQQDEGDSFQDFPISFASDKREKEQHTCTVQSTFRRERGPKSHALLKGQPKPPCLPKFASDFISSRGDVMGPSNSSSSATLSQNPIVDQLVQKMDSFGEKLWSQQRVLMSKVDTMNKRVGKLELSNKETKRRTDQAMTVHPATNNVTIPSEIYDSEIELTDLHEGIPSQYIISENVLREINRDARGPGNFAKRLVERLYPELFTAENLRRQYSYHGGGPKNKYPLAEDRKIVIRRYVTYFYPDLKQPCLWQSIVVTPINEGLRRPVEKKRDMHVVE